MGYRYLYLAVIGSRIEYWHIWGFMIWQQCCCASATLRVLCAWLMVTLMPTLTSVLVPAMLRPISCWPSLLAGMIWCGWTGAGRGHRAGQVSIHVIRVRTMHRAAAGRHWWHWWHTAHAQWSAAKNNRLTISSWFSVKQRRYIGYVMTKSCHHSCV